MLFGISSIVGSNNGLPTVADSSCARYSLSRSSRSASRYSRRLRCGPAIFDHSPPSNWARAAATARSTSWVEPAEMLLSTVSVAGLTTSKVSPLLESVHIPLTYIWRKPVPTDAGGGVEIAMLFLLSDRSPDKPAPTVTNRQENLQRRLE